MERNEIIPGGFFALGHLQGHNVCSDPNLKMKKIRVNFIIKSNRRLKIYIKIKFYLMCSM